MSSKDQKKIIDTENECESVGGPSIYNTMCLNYMSYMGYGDVCDHFSKETNSPIEPVPILERRSKIRKMIEEGQIDEVFSELNDINIELIDKDYYMYYILMQHKAYEKAYLIHANADIDLDTRQNLILEVLEYFKNELSQVVEEHPDLLPQLEDFLEYLIFNISNIKIEDKRSELADTINRIILNKCNMGENQLEKIIDGILLEENNLSKTNKFKEFKDIILDD